MPANLGRSVDRLAPKPKPKSNGNPLVRKGPHPLWGKREVKEDDAPYCIHEGCLCWRRRATDGTQQLVTLGHFTARITDQIIWDDGASSYRWLRITGELPDGLLLPSVDVLSYNFDNMKWVKKLWGVDCFIEPGAGRIDHLRAAIEYLSGRVRGTRMYAHTGWKEAHGKRFFLHAAGAIGNQDATVDLEPVLSRYVLPNVPEDVPQAIQASLDMMAVAPEEVTIPLWSAMYLAPLSEIIDPAFTVWVSGGSGEKKSTLAALALCHYGIFTEETLPTTWESTANYLVWALFVAKDIPLVIDDFAPGQSQQNSRELYAKAETVDRAQGNRSGRGRLQSDTKTRMTYYPRGLCISTGELTPAGWSHMARLYVIHVPQNSVNMPRLTVAQAQSERYRHAMAGYIAWLAQEWPRLQRELPALWADIRRESHVEGSHPRIPGTIAALYVGFHTATEFAQSQRVLDMPHVADMRRHALEVLQTVGGAQARLVKDEQPAQQFLRILQASIDQGTAVTVSKDQDPPDNHKGHFLGWRDDKNLYLIPEVAYQHAAQWMNSQGSYFGASMRSLSQQLKEAGIIINCVDGRSSSVIRGGTQARRVWTLPLSALLPENETQGSPSNG